MTGDKAHDHSFFPEHPFCKGSSCDSFSNIGLLKEFLQENVQESFSLTLIQAFYSRGNTYQRPGFSAWLGVRSLWRGALPQKPQRNPHLGKRAARTQIFYLDLIQVSLLWIFFFPSVLQDQLSAPLSFKSILDQHYNFDECLSSYSLGRMLWHPSHHSAAVLGTGGKTWQVHTSRLDNRPLQNEISVKTQLKGRKPA